MVFIKKASISREVWFSSEARQGSLHPAFSNNAVIDAAFEMYIVFEMVLGREKIISFYYQGHSLLSVLVIQVRG